MQAFAGIAVLVLVGVSLVVGLRLCARWRRGGGAPELLLGLMLFLTVGVGYPAMIAATRVDPSLARGAYVLGSVCVSAGFALLYVFTWRVFRREAWWAVGFAAAGALALVLNTVLQLHSTLLRPDLAIGVEIPEDSLRQTALVAVGYAWTAWEALRYHALLRRRARLGLADPVVANRLLLWGAMSLCVLAGLVLNAAALVQRIDVFEDPFVLLGSSCTGLSQALLLLLAFLPPRAYLVWVRSRAVA